MPHPEKSIPYLHSLLHSCTLKQSPPCLAHQLHSLLIKSNHISPFSSSLFHFYASNGSPSQSLLSFSSIPSSSLSTIHWTALISSHSRHSLFSQSLSTFRAMLRSASPPDDVTLLSVVSATARIAHLSFGRSAHLLFFKFGVGFSEKSFNAVMDMYVKCNVMVDAWRVFGEMPMKNVVSWTVILSGSVKFEGFESAREVFDRMPQKNEVSWTVMVVGYIEARRPKDAFLLIGQMIFGVDSYSVRNLNGVSICSMLSACSQAGDLAIGKWVHAHVTKSNISDDECVVFSTALIDMYSKCGRIETAKMVFEMMRFRNLVAWNAMLSGLSVHGLGYEVLTLFARMIEEESLKPDDITFVSVLSACSRSGLMVQGRKIFNDLVPVYKLRPQIEHYACMVDLLGRAGKLTEAEALVRKMPMPPNEVVLGSLLASCSLHGELELGRRLMNDLVEMDPSNTEYHVLLSNLYSSHERHAEADELWQEVKRGNTRKGPGVSYIEVDGLVHQFSAGDKSHPLTNEVYAKLDEMVQKMRLLGYVPNVASRISRVEDREEKEQGLLSHSERLAIAFGLVATRPGVPLRIFKNLRICSDCHFVVKLVSDIYKREIVIRDRNRFHCFKQGVCSCSDYW